MIQALPVGVTAWVIFLPMYLGGTHSVFTVEFPNAYDIVRPL